MKRAVVIVAFVVTVLGALAIRVIIEGQRALDDGDAWLLRGRPGEAIRSYETAARWYLPLAPHVDEAYAKLHALTASSNDAAVQLAAWRAIRGAALATRSAWQPHADDLVAANAAIAKISAGVPQAGTSDPAWHRERLDRPTRPSLGSVVLASLGIVLAIGGAIALLRRGIGPTGVLVRRVAALAGIAMVLGLAFWLATVGH